MKKYYIYALSWENKTKIGYTSNPKQRFGCLCSQAGVKRENATFSFYETTNPRLVEKNCHIMAENSYTRLAGEWFDCSHAQAISIIISNVTGGVCSEDHNPRLDKFLFIKKSRGCIKSCRLFWVEIKWRLLNAKRNIIHIHSTRTASNNRCKA